VLHLHNLNGNIVLQSGTQASPALGKDMDKVPFWAAGIDGTGEVGASTFRIKADSCMRAGACCTCHLHALALAMKGAHN